MFRENLDTVGSGEVDSQNKLTDEEDRFYLCVSCDNKIARYKDRIVINDANNHIFKNPAGIVYDVLCFSEAGGCITFGEPVDKFSWFAGYSWNYCLCSKCLAHTGWFYSNGKSFYGLIKDKLK